MYKGMKRANHKEIRERKTFLFVFVTIYNLKLFIINNENNTTKNLNFLKL